MSFDHSTEHEIRTRLVEVGLEKGEISELMSGVPSYGGLRRELNTSEEAIHAAALVDEYGFRNARTISSILARWPPTAARYRRVLALMERARASRPRWQRWLIR